MLRSGKKISYEIRSGKSSNSKVNCGKESNCPSFFPTSHLPQTPSDPVSAAAFKCVFLLHAHRPHHNRISRCLAVRAISDTRALLQGWLSPVRPGEHYLTTYISTFSPAISYDLSVIRCSTPFAPLTSFHSYASALWAVQAAAAAQSGVLAASYRATLLNH